MMKESQLKELPSMKDTRADEMLIITEGQEV